MKRLISICMALVMGCGFLLSVPMQAEAATWADINQSDVFLKQPQGSDTCTLYAATMLIRRVAIMDGRTDWRNYTADAVQEVAWGSNGLKGDFTYNGIRIVHSGDHYALEGTNKAEKLRDVLSRCPEGIVAYDRDKHHAILLTDYTDGTFYCAEPAGSRTSGRIPISSASITIDGIDDYWYCFSPLVQLDDNPAPTSHRLDIFYNANGGFIIELGDYSVGGEDMLYDRLGMSLMGQNWETGSCTDGGLFSDTQLLLKRTGYRFIGWSTSPSGGAIFQPNDASVISNTLYPDIVSQDGVVTVYAQWVYDNVAPTAIAHKDGHVYALYEYPLSFHEADIFCKTTGGHLATITSAEENQFITDELLSHATGPRYWLGASDEGHEGVWYWLYGGDSEFNYTNWDTGEPNNDNGYENYLQIYPYGRWNDGAESIYYWGFILEIEKLYPKKEVKYNNHVYQRFDTGINYLEAAEYCRAIGGQLVTINDADENEFIHDLINEEGAKSAYWIGLADLQKTKKESGFKWIDEPDCTYKNWYSRENAPQPDCYLENEFYAEIRKEDGTFNDNRNYNDGTEGFICEFKKKVASISVSKLPDKTKYVIGETFDPAGMELLVQYEDGTEQTINKGFTIGTVDLTEAGQKTVKVSYEGCETSFTIKVSKKSKRGDANDDGSIDLKDVTVMRRALANWDVEINEAAADVNNDGSFDLKDVVFLRRFLAGGWGFSLNKTALTLNTEGASKTYQLVSDYLDPDSLIWTSSDPTVAAVSADGLVTALKDGSATITVSENGDNVYCKVTVKTAYDEAWSEWSDFAATPITASDSVEVKTEGRDSKVLASYNMDCYCTRKADTKKRQFRNVSINGNFDGLGLDSGYGEHHHQYTFSAAEVQSATVIPKGGEQGGNQNGVNAADVNGYSMLYGGDYYIFYITSENYDTVTTTYYSSRHKIKTPVVYEN